MRTKDEILSILHDPINWIDLDRSRKEHQIDILIEVIIDIRDILDKRLQFPKSFLEQIIDKD